MADIDNIFVEYTEFCEKARSFCDALQTQISHIIVTLQNKEAIHEAIVTGRIKTWKSLSEKLKSRSISPENFLQLNDLIGFRIITLFDGDVDIICKEIEKNFILLKAKDNKKDSMEPYEFNYTSVHYDLRIPESWNNMPIFINSGDYAFELQVRTYGQHIWAAVSHVLNYKQNVPLSKTKQRELHSWGAMLDELDVHLEVLRKEQQELSSRPLSLENLPGILEDAYPSANSSVKEEYAELLGLFARRNIKTQGDLFALLNKHRAFLTEQEAEGVRSKNSKPYFTRCGYVKVALSKELQK